MRPTSLLIGTLAARLVLAPATVYAQDAIGLPDSALLVVPPLSHLLTASASSDANRRTSTDSAVAVARAQLGTRYYFGGESPRGFDCSGLVQYVMHALDVDLPRTARAQAKVGVPVPRDTARLRPGDLLTFGTGQRVSHIGIYVGHGRYVHASTGAGRVVERPLLRAPAPGMKPWIGARRMLAGDEPLQALGSRSPSSGRPAAAVGGG